MLDKIQKAASILILGMQILPALMKLVQEVEAVVSVPGQGEAKLELVTKSIVDTTDLIPADVKAEVGLAKVESVVKNWVSNIVGFFNRTGLFTTTKK